MQENQVNRDVGVVPGHYPNVSSVNIHHSQVTEMGQVSEQKENDAIDKANRIRN